MRRWRRGATGAPWFAAVLLVVVTLVSGGGGGGALLTPVAAVTPFSIAFQRNDNGGIEVIGNQLLTCPDTDPRCAGTRAGTARYNNNAFAMVPLDADAVAATTSSSSSDLTLPPDSTVLFAGLYWGARLSRGTGGTAATTDPAVMSFRLPGDAGYRTVTAQRQFGPTVGDGAYQQFADVTALVAAGPGSGTYWGADVAAGTGEDRYAGWSLAVAYRTPTLPLRNLTVFDGFTDVGQGNPQTVQVSGFRAPVSGPVDAQLGMVAYEGDFTTSGDSAQLNGTQLGTRLSPGSNFFNGTNDDSGSSVRTRSPADVNMLGFDVKNLGASGVIPNGATSATLSLSSTGDRYFPGVLTTAINLFAPDFTPSTKTVTDLDGHAPPRPGDRLQYTVTLPNVGGDPAASAVATDVLPGGTTYVPGSLRVLTGANAGAKSDAPGDDQGEYDVANRTVRVRLGSGATAQAGGTIGVQESTSFSFVVTADASTGGRTVTNTASLAFVAQTLGEPFVFSPAPVSTPVATFADLALTKTVTPDPAVSGGPIQFDLVVTNAGPSTAVAAALRDQVPAGVTLSSATPSQGTCSVTAVPLTCALGDVPNGGRVTVRLVGRTSTSGTAPAVTNVASVASTTSDPDPSDNTAGATADLRQQADLRVTKSVSAARIVPGAPVTYLVTATNAGPSDAVDVRLADTTGDSSLVPLLTAAAPGAACTANGQSAQCTLGRLAAGASVTMTVTGALSSAATLGTVVADLGTAGSATPDPATDDNRATATVTAAPPQADVAVIKQGPASVVAGRSVTYTVRAVNNGPSNATGVELRDPVPAGVTVTSAVSTRGSCTYATGPGATVVCAVGGLVAGPPAPPGQPTGSGAEAVVTITGTVASDTAPGALTNRVTATSTSQDPNPANDSASATAQVGDVADVGITKTADPAVPQAGQPIRYVLRVGNDGPSTARGLVVTDVLPPELSFVSATPSSGTCAAPSGGRLVCRPADLAVGSSTTVEVVMNVPATYAGAPVRQSASVATTASTDETAGNNAVDYTVSQTPSADLSLTKTADLGTAVAGEPLTYTLAVANAGPLAAAGVQVSDPLPDGTTFLSASPGCALAGRTVTCTLGAVPVGATPTRQVTVRVDPDVATATVLTNTAEVTSSTPDPSTANNRGTATTPVTARANVAVSKAADPGGGPAGSYQLFTIDVRNDGPSVARDVTLVDAADVEAAVGQIVGATCDILSGELQCTLDGGPLGVGETRTVYIQTAIASNARQGAYTNTVRVASTTPEAPQDAADDVATAPLTVTPPEADLSIEKTSQTSPLVPGEGFVYRLSVQNLPYSGTFFGSDAPDVVVIDALPPGLTATSAVATQGDCSVQDGTLVRCRLGTLPGVVGLSEPAPVVVVVTGTVAAGTSGTEVANTATVSSPVQDPDQANNASTAVTPISRRANLSVTKTADADPVVAGARVVYTVAVTNAGPSDAAAVTLRDVLPSGLTFDPDGSDPVCAVSGDEVGCTLALVPAGETVTVPVAARLDPAAPAGRLTNTVTVSSADPTTSDPDPSDNSGSVSTAVTRAADLEVTKTVDVTAPTAGQTVTYSLSLANAGPSTAEGALFTDPLPAGAVLVGTSAPAGVTCSSAGTPTTVRCEAGTLTPGAPAVEVQVDVRYPEGLLPGPYDNTATATSTTPDPVPDNSSATAAVDLQVVADTSIVKTVVTDPVVAGAPVTFRLAARNAGPATAPDVVLTDTLPTGYAFVGAVVETGTGSCEMTVQEGLTVVTCPVGALPLGGTASVLLTLLAPASAVDAAGTVTNTAAVGSGALDPAASDNSSTVSAPVLAAPGAVPTSPGATPAPTSSPTGSPATPGPPGSAAGPSGGLPGTGSPVLVQLALAGGLLVAGAGIRLRRHRAVRSPRRRPAGGTPRIP